MNRDSFSLSKGATFYFEEDGHVICSWFSSFSGLEKVFVDGDLVSKQRNLSIKSDQTFKISANTYKSEFSTNNLFKGPFVCTLYKNGSRHKIKKLVFQDENVKTPFYMKFWFFLILGLAYGVISAALKFPDWASAVFILTIFAFAYSYSKVNKVEPKIVEENV